MDSEGSAVAVGIDAAVVANHRVVVRRPVAGGPGVVVDDFVVPPTLAGMDALAKRLSGWRGAVAVAEPTSMTWLPLSIALDAAGVELALVGNRHAARLRSALAGKNKSDPIDAAMLSRAGEFFELAPARIPDAAELALRRAAQRRAKTLIDANRAWRRLVSQARWAFPDVWNAFAGSRPTALGSGHGDLPARASIPPVCPAGVVRRIPSRHTSSPGRAKGFRATFRFFR
jgi:transposase